MKTNYQIIYSILDYPDRMESSNLTVDEIHQVLNEHLNKPDNEDFRFIGSKVSSRNTPMN